MDRAERRQRRLEQKIWQGERAGKGRGRRHKPEGSEASNCERLKCCHCGQGDGSTPKLGAGPAGPNSACNTCGLERANKGKTRVLQNVSEEESTDGVTVYEGEMNPSLQDLQAQLHLSDARGLKWQKIAAERLEENKELQTEIQCLNLKIKEITDAKAVHQVQLESRLRAEIQSLKEKNDEWIKGLDNYVKHISSADEMLIKLRQDAKSNKQNTHHQASQRTVNAGRIVHETSAEVNVCIGDQTNGHLVSSKKTGNLERNGCESAAEVHVDVEQQNSGYPQRTTQHSGERGTKIAQQLHVDGSPNKCPIRTEKSAHLEKYVHDSKADMAIDIGGESTEDAGGGKPDTPSSLQKVSSAGDVRPAEIPSEDVSEVLFSATERESALALVNQEFLVWLNSRTRRPTPKEMSFHKSQIMQRSWPPGEESFYWTGIPGSLLLDRFHGDTQMEKPRSNALNTLLRSVLHIEGSKRAEDMLWCLVWADCMNPAQLPGYAQNLQDTKRARTADDEVAIKSTKVRHP